MTAPRVVFLGNDPWSVPPLRALAASPTPPVLVVTRTPRPAGRGSKLRPTEVARFATEAGLALREVERVRDGDGFAALSEAAPDVLAVVAYGELLTPAVLGLPSAGSLNLHFSLLPRWRGAAPVQRALMTGDALTGVSVMVIDEGLDTGPVLRTIEEPIRADDDAGALGSRLAEIGGAALRDAIAPFVAGDLVATPQPAEGVTVAPKVSRDERWIDWSRDAESIGRLVRALAPAPGASARFRDADLKVLAGRPEAGGAAVPGSIVQVAPGGVLVATGDGAYRIEAVAPSGRRRMAADAWARGARFGPTDRLA